jgi:hypothetical protein
MGPENWSPRLQLRHIFGYSLEAVAVDAARNRRDLPSDRDFRLFHVGSLDEPHRDFVEGAAHFVELQRSH